jgi:hypothetical protein
MAKDASVFEQTLADLSNVPDISGAWECASRKMWERNPGEGEALGIKNVDPPDPRAPGGRIVIQIDQDRRTYTSGDVVNATHDHETQGFYTGNGTFAFTTTRIADDNNRSRRLLGRVLSGLLGVSFNDSARRMVLNGTATLVDDNTLRVTVVGAVGGNPDPHPDRDPPPGYTEERIYTRKQPAPASL